MVPHEAATYIGHTKQIQEEHYLRIMEDAHMSRGWWGVVVWACLDEVSFVIVRVLFLC
jgi:hypothetical protein